MLPRPVHARHHHRLHHRRIRGQYRFDLAGFDPEPPDLHLIIDPATKLQLPRTIPPHQITRPIQP
ncbi:hypothetical protein, partial [Nocardia sputi]|uniref:hypothetical protein n=1 Tax=Nocardia sputi TaxID=2943705 RepID=UPI001F1A2512